MKLFRQSVFFIAFILSSSALVAQAGVTEAQRKAVNNSLKKISKHAGRDIVASDIQTTPISGLLQVTSDLSVFYVSTDGNYILFGELIDVNKDKMKWSLTEQVVRKLRQVAIDSVDSKNMIIYPATGKKIGIVNVFFDIDCGYCHKLIEKMSDYNAQGIEIRILAFPRSGPDTDSYKKAIAVWCASDPAQAMISATKDNKTPDKQCKTKAVDIGFELGNKIGVSGTPTIVLSNGIKIPGLVSPEELAKIIKEQGK